MSLRQRLYPELDAGGFSRLDGSVEFYTRVQSLLRPDWRVLDFGAGRNWIAVEDFNGFGRKLVDLRPYCARVVGADVDPVVAENPVLHESVVLQPGGRLPFADASFDLIVSDHVFEHLDQPIDTAAELDRILRPGGWICARTPNRRGYIALSARLVPNRLHSRALHRLQPGRSAIDVFPTRYRLNTKHALHRCFPDDVFRHCTYSWNGEPSYYGRSDALWLAVWAWLRIAPRPLCATWMVFLQKRDVRAASAGSRW